MISFMFFFFFFQAEDGIRDKLVTGVQTCALPISRGVEMRRCPGTPSGPGAVFRGTVAFQLLARARSFGLTCAQGIRTLSPGGNRSEERRVGKECRARWWAEVS